MSKEFFQIARILVCHDSVNIGYVEVVVKKSRDAHLQLQKEYQLLVGDEITNVEFREFAMINSTKVGRTLLNECCSHKNRHSKARIDTIDLV